LHDLIQTQKILKTNYRKEGARMSNESKTVSAWFKTKSGFKVYAACPACQSSNISYFKTRKDGLKGISTKSRGLTPVCIDCGRNFPSMNSPQKVNHQQFQNRKVV